MILLLALFRRTAADGQVAWLEVPIRRYLASSDTATSPLRFCIFQLAAGLGHPPCGLRCWSRYVLSPLPDG